MATGGAADRRAAARLDHTAGGHPRGRDHRGPRHVPPGATGPAGNPRSRRPVSAGATRSPIPMPDLSGKQGLIVGVANRRSISWAIAQAAQAAGARLALTYPSQRLEENVRELAGKLDNPVVLPCDVASDEQIAALRAALDREFGGLDFFLHGAAFAPAPALDRPFVQTSREDFRIALDVSTYSLPRVSRPG